MSLDDGGRQLAGQVLDAGGRGEEARVAQLIAPLDESQLRSLVGVLAQQVDQAMPAPPPSGPATVCEKAVEASAQAFGTTPEAIVSSSRTSTVSDARAVAMTVARRAGLKLPAIAAQFHKDHSSVIDAVRRTEARPHLAKAADHIAGQFADWQRTRLPRAPELPEASTAPLDQVVAAAAKALGAKPEAVFGRDQSQPSADARAVAMAAALRNGMSLTRIAETFSRDHTTVLGATRRVANTPPLERIADQLTARMPTTPADAATNGEPSIEPAARLGRVQQEKSPPRSEHADLRIAR
ncbi:MAG: hypothetical protein L0H74_05965 [Brachybacterium sp.]|nr:hypothetical protein [Brachybacterium sp.]